MLELECASDFSSAGAAASGVPSLLMSFARRDLGLKWTLPGVTVSTVWTISHSLTGSVMERWTIFPSRDSKRRRPHGVRSASRRWPRGQVGSAASGAAGPDVVSVAFFEMV